MGNERRPPSGAIRIAKKPLFQGVIVMVAVLTLIGGCAAFFWDDLTERAEAALQSVIDHSDSTLKIHEGAEHPGMRARADDMELALTELTIEQAKQGVMMGQIKDQQEKGFDRTVGALDRLERKLDQIPK